MALLAAPSLFILLSELEVVFDKKSLKIRHFIKVSAIYYRRCMNTRPWSIPSPCQFLLHRYVIHNVNLLVHSRVARLTMKKHCGTPAYL